MVIDVQIKRELDVALVYQKRDKKERDGTLL